MVRSPWASGFSHSVRASVSSQCVCHSYPQLIVGNMYSFEGANDSEENQQALVWVGRRSQTESKHIHCCVQGCSAPGMGRLAERRLQRLQQIRAQDAAYSTQLALEAKRSKHAVEAAAVSSLDRAFAAERATRELQLREQYDAAMAVVGEGHAGAQQAHTQHVERASEQYWAFVRSQQAEQHRNQAAQTQATHERLQREKPHTDLVQRKRRVAEVEQERAAAAAATAAAATAAAARQQIPAPLEAYPPASGTDAPSTFTHLHAVRAPVVVRETEETAFDAARLESERLAAARRQDADIDAARSKAAAERGKDALARLRTDQVRARAFPWPLH